MQVLYIVLAILIGSIFSIYIINFFYKHNRRQVTKYWKVDDCIEIKKDYKSIHESLKEHGMDYSILRGWNKEYIYVHIGGNVIRELPYSSVVFNYTDKWRRNYIEAERYMKQKPGFKAEPTIDDWNQVQASRSQKASSVENKQGFHFIDGKAIETMTEVECQVYLAKALEEEDYKTAKLIQKRQEQFR